MLVFNTHDLKLLLAQVQRLNLTNDFTVQDVLKLVCRPFILMLWICYISMKVDSVDMSFYR